MFNFVKMYENISFFINNEAKLSIFVQTDENTYFIFIQFARMCYYNEMLPN